MEKDQTISVLIKDCVRYFEQNRYTVHRVERYKTMWRNGICRYMEDKGIRHYDPTVGNDFIQDTISSVVTPAERDVIRSISVLTEMQETGRVSKRTVHKVPREFIGSIGVAIKGFISWLEKVRRSRSTINNHYLYLHRFNQYLENNEVHRLKDIGQDHILSFVSTQTNNNVNVASSLRVFFRFAHEEKFLDRDWSWVLKNHKWIKREKLPSVYTAEEVLQIESSVSRSSGVGKRNYAILLLATRLGLRASDIAHLSFASLDWGKSRMVLEQYKTGKETELPLLAEVGGAIIDYLKSGRQSSSSTRVFLSARAPFRPMAPEAVSHVVRQIMDASGVTVGKRKQGPHAMRHSLASRLLENSVSLPVISESLGHQNTQTTMAYLRVDIRSLRECALDVPAVEPSFYSQGGGVYHG